MNAKEMEESMFNIDIMSRSPVYEQIIKQAQDFILTGLLKPNDKMPSVRSLSVSLAINPNTIQKAYSELDRMKIIYTVPGKGSFVSEDAQAILHSSQYGKLTNFENTVHDFKLAGIPKEELQKIISKIYEEGK